MQAPDAELSSGFRFISQFSPADDCTPLGQGYRPPQPGDRFHYVQVGGPRSDRTVTAVDGVVVASRLEVFPDAKKAERVSGPISRRMVAGIIPATGAAVGRNIQYAADPWPILSALAAGETVLMDMVERSDFGARRVLRAPLLVRYEGCGVLKSAIGDDRVRAYRVSTPGVSYRPATGAEARRGEITVYLSARFGFQLAFQSGRTSIITAVDRAEG